MLPRPPSLQTMRVMDLLTNSTLATINHDSRIDWLVGAGLWQGWLVGAGS